MSSVGLALLMAAAAVGADKPDERPPVAVERLNRSDAVAFDKEILPILANKCQTCHSGSVQKGKLDLGTYEALMRGGKSGAAIAAGRSAESLLVKHAGRTQKPFMPPPGEDDLSPAELALLKLWIDQGARGSAIARPKAEVKLRPLPARIHTIRALAISPDKSLIAVGRGATIHLYAPGNGKLVRTLGPMSSVVDALAFSPEGKSLAAGSFRELVIWSSGDGAMQRRVTGFADRVNAVAWSPNGGRIATGGGSPTADGELKLLDAATGNVLLDKSSAHSDTIFGVSFRPDGSLFATAGADKFVKVWTVPDGQLRKTFEGHSHHVLDVGWKADGRILASAGADDVIKVWDFDKGEAVRTIRGHGKQITRLVFVGKSANVLTCSGDTTARLWNINGGNLIRSLTGASDFLYAVAASADGTLIATGGEDGVVRLYDGAGRALRSLR